ncbi:hypothetical protein DIPPA_19884 [Diplonema papillatum]|nr:hypothetical protein DIPPA_19884 [Diplonema papillatum]
MSWGAAPPADAGGLQYLLTFGGYEFVAGATDAPPLQTLAQVLSGVLARHHGAIATANGGSGSAMNEMYNQFLTRSDAISIVAQPRGNKGGGAMAASLADTVGYLQQYNCLSVRFHIDALVPPQSGSAEYRKRLHRFYNYYNPEKLVVADRMLKDARGFEEELLQTLVMKYGPEPAPCVDLRFRDRLAAFYHHYNPDRVKEIDEILLEYSGMEEQLFSALVAKYGPEPIIVGSEADSDDSFTYTNDTTKEFVDPFPLSVPLMPFITPLHDHELPNVEAGETGIEFSSDVHFWDNFVNQMPGDAGVEEYGKGIDCNQELLQQFIRSYPVLFPHIVTATCPYKERVFRASHEFWTYSKARAEANVEEVEEADPAHVVRAVSSLDVHYPAILFTRREWQDLCEDWQQAHGLSRRVHVGSVALDIDPNAPLQLPARPPPVAAAPAGPETYAKPMQTIADSVTQTRPMTPPPSPPRAPPTPPPPATPRLGHTSGRLLPVAWPVAALASASPSPIDDTEPPAAGDSSMEPYLRATLAEAQRRKRGQQGRGVPAVTQTSGWIPPAKNSALTRAGPSPRKESTRVHGDPLPRRTGLPTGDMRTIRVTPSESPLSGAHRPRDYSAPHTPRMQANNEADFMPIIDPSSVMAKLQGIPRASPHRARHDMYPRGPQPGRRHASGLPQYAVVTPFSAPDSYPRVPSAGYTPKDQYWKAFLDEMQSITGKR